MNKIATFIKDHQCLLMAYGWVATLSVAAFCYLDLRRTLEEERSEHRRCWGAASIERFADQGFACGMWTGWRLKELGGDKKAVEAVIQNITTMDQSVGEEWMEKLGNYWGPPGGPGPGRMKFPVPKENVTPH